MKKRKKTPIRAFPALALLAVALLAPAAVNYLGHNAGTLERAAIFSAALSMPQSGFDLLRERFRGNLHDDSSAEDSNSSQQPPAPQSSAAPATSPPADEPLTAQDSPWQARAEAPAQIPEEYAAQLISEDFSGKGNSALISFGAAFIKNDTKHSDEKVERILQDPISLALTDTGEPLVLILHTHATESFERYDSDLYDTRNTWRSTDNRNNMVAVGAEMARVLQANGIGVLHDTTQHDFPSYNGSYERSAKTVKAYLAEYPSIQIVLDLHRDAMERENGAIIKPIATIDGKKAAQIMIISGCDDGTMNMPDWEKNLRLAALFNDYMESQSPGLTRPVYFCYRKYNMDLSPGALLLEFGSQANTLEESVYAAALAGQALSNLIRDNMQ